MKERSEKQKRPSEPLCIVAPSSSEDGAYDKISYLDLAGAAAGAVGSGLL
jgi:hypothetical protein